MWVAVCKEFVDQALSRLHSTLDLVIGIVDAAAFIQVERPFFITWQDCPLFAARNCIIIVEAAKVYWIWAKKLSFLCPELALPMTAISSNSVRNLDAEAWLKIQNYSCRMLSLPHCLSLFHLIRFPDPFPQSPGQKAAPAACLHPLQDLLPPGVTSVVKVPGHCLCKKSLRVRNQKPILTSKKMQNASCVRTETTYYPSQGWGQCWVLDGLCTLQPAIYGSHVDMIACHTVWNEIPANLSESYNSRSRFEMPFNRIFIVWKNCRWSVGKWCAYVGMFWSKSRCHLLHNRVIRTSVG